MAESCQDYQDTGALRPAWVSAVQIHEVMIRALGHSNCARDWVLLMQTSEQMISIYSHRLICWNLAKRPALSGFPLSHTIGVRQRLGKERSPKLRLI